MRKLFGNLIRSTYKTFNHSRKLANSRKKAKELHNDIIKKKDRTIADKKQIDRIKAYSNEFFGSSDYWPWLALYTEIRGEFLEGWIPDDYYSFELIPRLNPRPISMLSTFKSFDHRLFKNFACEPVAVKISGFFFDSNQRKIKENEFLNLLKSVQQELIIKTDGGPSGEGHIFIHSENIDFSLFKNIPDCVIQPAVKQHEQLNRLYNKSVNTIRVTTLLRTNAKVVHKHISLRFGKGGSRIDNSEAGGFFMYLDISGNVVSPAYNKLGIELGSNHPDTGFNYKTLKVPSVTEAVSMCKESHLKFPYAKFIAWDVYIDENGKPGLLEWNARLPGMWVNEALIGPLFSEESFFKIQ